MVTATSPCALCDGGGISVIWASAGDGKQGRQQKQCAHENAPPDDWPEGASHSAGFASMRRTYMATGLTRPARFPHCGSPGTASRPAGAQAARRDILVAVARTARTAGAAARAGASSLLARRRSPAAARRARSARSSPRLVARAGGRAGDAGAKFAIAAGAAVVAAGRGSSRGSVARSLVLGRRSSWRRRRSRLRLLLILILVLVGVVIVALAAALLLEAGAVLVEDAEIMVGILQIIFGLDAVALHLRVAGQALVFLQELRGIAALPVVLAVAGTGIACWAARPPPPPPAAPAAALTIVDQTKILTNGGSTLPLPAGPFPAAHSARPRRQAPQCGLQPPLRKSPLASDQAIGGRRRQALTHPLLWSAPSLRPYVATPAGQIQAEKH